MFPSSFQYRNRIMRLKDWEENSRYWIPISSIPVNLLIFQSCSPAGKIKKHRGPNNGLKCFFIIPIHDQDYEIEGLERLLIISFIMHP
jgi:hypothetical protein